MSTHNYLDKTGLGQVWEKIRALITQSDWEEDTSSDSAYILNKPAIKAGEGENSILVGQTEQDEDTQVFDIAISTSGSTTSVSYTSDSTITLPSTSWYYYVLSYEAGGVTYYREIESIDTENHIINTSSSVAGTHDNLSAKLYYKYKISGGKNSYAEGYSTISGSNWSHAEGWYSKAIGSMSHAEGSRTSAINSGSHSEGNLTVSKGAASHSEGTRTVASGSYSHAEGYYTTAQRRSQHVFGEYNVLDTGGSSNSTKGNYIEIVGKGTSDSVRSNARTLDWSGNEVLAGKLTVGTAPTVDMDVATKKYVDDNVGSIDLSNYLAKNNTTSYTPTGDYNPATKKYVDDKALMVVNITVTPSETETTHSADKTFAEITEHINNGGDVVCKINTLYYSLYTIDQDFCVFTKISLHNVLESSDVELAVMNVVITSSNEIYVNDEYKTILELGTTSSTAFRGDYGNAAYAHSVTNKGSAFSNGLYKITTNSEGHVTAATAVAKDDITGLGIPAQDTTYTFDGTYNSSTNKAATVSTVTNAVSGKANSSDVLTKTNITSYTPTSDYHPATKKYVDDNISSEIYYFTLSSARNNTVTYDEVYAEHVAGKVVYAVDQPFFYRLTNANNYGMGFVNNFNNKVNRYTWNKSDNTITYTSYPILETNISSPADGQLLKYNATTSKWENITLSLAISNNTIQLKEGNTVISSVNLPVYNGGVSS